MVYPSYQTKKYLGNLLNQQSSNTDIINFSSPGNKIQLNPDISILPKSESGSSFDNYETSLHEQEDFTGTSQQLE